MKKVLVLSSAFVVFLLVSCSGGKTNSSIAVPSSVQAAQGSSYAIKVFAQAPGDLQPDDVVEQNGAIWVVCQDPNINPDGTLPTGVTSAQSKEIVYNLKGNVLKTLNLPGHPDGEVVFDSSTIWVSSNEDANPIITVINTSTYAMQSYSADVPALPHGGGLDDLKVVNGVVYATASNPSTTFTPTPNLAPYSTDGSGATAEYGVNTGRALYSISLNADGVTFHSTPVLMSSTATTLLPTPGSPVTLNMTDADSSALAPGGDFVEDSQQDSELVFIQNLGTASQSTSVLPLTLYGNPWPVDDTRWSPASGSSFMLLSDPPAQLIYRIDATTGSFAPNSVYSSGQGTLLQTNTTTGFLTPVYVGMNNPHGILFVAD
jgi:hypothetical protein